MHDTCQTTTKVKEELIQQVRDGNFIEDSVVKVSSSSVFNRKKVFQMDFLDYFQCYVHCFMEMLHLMEGTVGQFHVADKHTDYMIPSELFDETIKAFGHCEDASKKKFERN